MTAGRKNYLRRVDFIKKLTIVRNICFAIGLICGIPLLGEYMGEHIVSFYAIHISLVVLLIGLVAGIEYFILNVAIFDGDIDFEPIFDWYIRDNRMSYEKFLKINKLVDSDISYRKYRKEISCI